MKTYHRVILKVLAVLATLVFIGLCGLIVMKGLDQSVLDVTFYQLSSSKVSQRLRIVQLTDLHLSEFGTDNQALVEKVRSLSPDIIAITGDMNIQSNPDYTIVLTLCRQLLDIAPVYYSLGNHEYVAQIFSDSNIQSDLKALGVHVLDNTSEIVTIGENTLQIIGISETNERLKVTYGGEKTTAERFIEKFGGYDGFNLLLIHYPDAVPGELADFSVDLALCGHEHGGLIRIPGIGGLYAPDEGFLPKYASGYFQFANNAMIVSRGLGNSHTVPRFNNNPEIVVVDITYQAVADADT